MLAQRASTFRLIGAGVTSVGVLAAIFGAGGSKAQTLANLETDRAAYLQSQCGHIGDGAERVGCMAAKSIELSRAQTALKRDEAAAARKQADEDRKAAAKDREATAAIEIRTQCLTDITAALKASPPRITVDDVRAARAAAPNDPCGWATRLGVRSQRHGALSKQ